MKVLSPGVIYNMHTLGDLPHGTTEICQRCGHERRSHATSTWCWATIGCDCEEFLAAEKETP